MEQDKQKPDFSGPLELLKAIKEKHPKERGVQGTIACPCCGADARYSIARSNGHIHARCSGCGIGFMQ